MHYSYSSSYKIPSHIKVTGFLKVFPANRCSYSRYIILYHHINIEIPPHGASSPLHHILLGSLPLRMFDRNLLSLLPQRNENPKPSHHLDKCPRENDAILETLAPASSAVGGTGTKHRGGGREEPGVESEGGGERKADRGLGRLAWILRFGFWMGKARGEGGAQTLGSPVILGDFFGHGDRDQVGDAHEEEYYPQECYGCGLVVERTLVGLSFELLVYVCFACFVHRVSQVFGKEASHHSHRFTHDEDQRLLSNGDGIRQEEKRKGDVEEGERGYYRGS